MALASSVGRRTRIVTSNLVVAESHARIMRRAGIAAGLRVSFAIMAERGTRAALTLDRQFAIAGYQMVTE